MHHRNISNGQTVIVRATSSSGPETLTQATLTVGGVDDTFSVTTLPEAPTISSTTAENTVLTFNWNSVIADHFYLLENADGTSGFSRVGDSIASGSTSTTLDVAVHLLDWDNAEYAVEACDASDNCNSPTSVDVTSKMLNAINRRSA